jgi:hypothetical protein
MTSFLTVAQVAEVHGPGAAYDDDIIRAIASRRRRFGDRDRVCYFAQCARTGLIKIGITGNLEERLAWLSCATGLAVKLLGVVQDVQWPEEVLHALFDHWRVDRSFESIGTMRLGSEWFRPAPELLAFIASEAALP